MVELSVIIPTYNRAERIRACLDALCHQTQPFEDFEVIVVVDGSTDGTREVLRQIQTPYTLRIIEQENKGQPAALNRGAQAAKGRYCLFLDDDIVADHQLVAEHLRSQTAHGGILAIGHITLKVQPRSDWFARGFAQGWAEHYARLNHGARRLTYNDCYGGNMSVPREQFKKAGCWAEDLQRNFDIELAYRLEKVGLSFVYIPSAVGIQDERKSLRALMADAEMGGAACVDICSRHPSMVPELLGTFHDAGRFEVLLRRLFLKLHLPGHPLAIFGLMSPSRHWAYLWHCFLHRYAYWHGVRSAVSDIDTWKRLTYGTPILVYHAFGAPGEPPSRYVIPVRRFRRQMAWLRRMGYRVLSLEEYLSCRRAFRLPPARSIIITMDGGYKDNKTLALPVLREYGFPATIFLASSQIRGKYHSEVPSEVNSRAMLSGTDVHALAQEGWQFGAHTRTLRNPTTLNGDQALMEIEGSKKDLENQLGTSIRVFSYPYGDSDTTVGTFAEQAGFLGSCGTQSGLNTLLTPLHNLRRVEIYGTDSLLDFAIAVRLGERTRTLRRLFVQLLSHVPGLFRPVRNVHG